MILQGDGQEHWFRVDMAAGQNLKLDVDYGTHDIGVSVATRAVVYASNGSTEMGRSGGSSILGGGGSTSSQDAYLSFRAAVAGTYYIKLVTSGDVALPSGATALAHFSLTGITPGAVAEQAGDDVLNGDDGNDIMFGGAGNDVMNGGAGTDTIRGGTGNDMINGGGDRDKVFGDEGDDTFTLATTAVLDDVDGGSGNDLLSLSTYSVAMTVNLGTSSGELTGNTLGDEGEMIVRSIEKVAGTAFGDTLTGNASNNTFYGGAGDDTMNGADGADVLQGGAGNDVMAGGRGDDSYYVDAAGDVVTEAANQGLVDRVFTTVAYSLAAGVEVEFLQFFDVAGTTDLNLTGNSLSQLITGNAGNNILNTGGSANADVLRGLAGDDIYQLQNSADRIDETAGNGSDTVMAAVSFKLAADDHIEFLTTNDADGTSNINLTGNARAQTIIGNDGNNVLNGLKGVDVMTGNGGDDRFVISTPLKGGNIDEVTDFNVDDDEIAIDNRIFTGMANGALDANRLEVNTTGEATDGATRLIYESDTGHLYYDRDGDRSGVARLILELDTGLAIDESNFFIL
jgi:Ca2+-binding RTX toxin-like protein